MRVETEIAVYDIPVLVRGDYVGGDWQDVEAFSGDTAWLPISWLGPVAEQAALEALQDDWTRFERDMEAQDA